MSCREERNRHHGEDKKDNNEYNHNEDNDNNDHKHNDTDNESRNNGNITLTMSAPSRIKRSDVFVVFERTVPVIYQHKTKSQKPGPNHWSTSQNHIFVLNRPWAATEPQGAGHLLPSGMGAPSIDRQAPGSRHVRWHRAQGYWAQDTRHWVQHGAPGSRLRVPRASGIGAARHHFLVFQTEDGPQPKREQTRMGSRALGTRFRAPCSRRAPGTVRWHRAQGYWRMARCTRLSAIVALRWWHRAPGHWGHSNVTGQSKNQPSKEQVWHSRCA